MSQATYWVIQGKLQIVWFYRSMMGAQPIRGCMAGKPSQSAEGNTMDATAPHNSTTCIAGLHCFVLFSSLQVSRPWSTPYPLLRSRPALLFRLRETKR